MSLIFPIIIVVMSVVLFLVHFVVYKGLITMLGVTSGIFILWLKIFLIVFGGGFVLSILIASRYNNIATRVLYTLSAEWYGFLFYLFIAVIIGSVLTLVFGGVIPSQVFVWISRALIIFAICVGIYGLVNGERIQVTTYDVSLPNLPASWKGRRAVWISDIHLGQVHGAEYAGKIVARVNALNPDIIFIGGDLYDGVKVNDREIINPLRNLKAKLGVYFITGNHEEFSDKTHFVDAVKNLGILVLDNKMVTVDGVRIIGVDDRDSTQPQNFDAILSGLSIDKTIPTILLKHQPSGLDIAEGHGISMQISGHTHKGQMYPLSYITRLVYNGYDYGYKQYGSMQVYTSSGVGTWGPPQRVGTKSEIILMNFK